MRVEGETSGDDTWRDIAFRYPYRREEMRQCVLENLDENREGIVLFCLMHLAL